MILVAVIGAMLSALTYGLWQNNFGPLKDVWTGAGPLTGAIIGYYFHRGERSDMDTVIGHPAVAQAEKTPTENAKPAGKSRVQLDLQPRAMAMLNELKEKTDAASYAEVFKHAMKLYDGIITELERGNTFLIRDPDGKISEFRMFL